MPIVPEARNVVDFPSPGVSARVEAPDMGAGGAMVGRSLEGLGSQLNDAAQRQEEINTVHDHAAVKEQINKNLTWYTDAGYTGKDAYFQKDGRNAVEAQPIITKGLDEQIAANRAGLNNPRQQKMYDLAMQEQRAEWGVKIAEHGATQETKYDQEQSAGLQTNAAELAKAQYLNQPDAAEKQIDTGLTEVDRYYRSQGVPDSFIAAKKLEYTSGIYKDVGANIAYSGPDGPKVAQALLDQHGGSMTADDRYAVATHIRTAQDTINAEQHRQEAEQRQLVNQARKDAEVRVQTVIDNTAAGIPMDPKTFASARADAITTNNPGLVKRIDDLQLKNTTLFTHQHDTPTDLQNQINVMSADIAQAGTKADSADIVKRDTLQQLYSTSMEQLRSNGIGYAATHYGLPVQPLNLMDPNSIASRAAVAQRASALSGTQVSPLQPAEIQPLTQQWRAGDANAKVGLVMNLAKFGSLAPAAAQQIAPNDAGLVHLIGLASHSNRAVAISRVNQAMAGYEAMKTEGQIVGKLASQPDFNTFTGTALQFMPGARDGVFTVAKALLAEDASQHGWSDNNAADDKAWYRAVNSALGSYSRGEVQYGGLAGFNGAQTVLPENMSLDDFETRISRANGPQLRAASNGLPVTGNGTQLDASDLKKMHFIPIDDGVYRLETGGAFVHTKDGHPFEVDVRKLNSPVGGGAQRPFGALDSGQYDRSTWDKRPDGSAKGTGFLGVIKRPDGTVSSEISVGVPVNGKEMDIPTMVPGLTPQEMHWLLTTPVSKVAKELPDSIRQKAIAHAKARIAAGKSVFKQDNERSAFDQQLAAHGYTRR